jgi:3-keto steroid reductase
MPPRVVWISSSEARPGFADPEDWQLVKTQHSYEASKYQMDLLGTRLNRQPHNHSIVRHFVVMPGVVSTNIGVALVGALMEIMKVVVFYLVRCLSLNSLSSLTSAAGSLLWFNSTHNKAV